MNSKVIHKPNKHKQVTLWTINTRMQFTIFGYMRQCACLLTASNSKHIIPDDIMQICYRYYYQPVPKIHQRLLNYRIHRKPYPNVGDNVLITFIKHVPYTLCFVLLEYNMMHGYVMTWEIDVSQYDQKYYVCGRIFIGKVLSIQCSHHGKRAVSLTIKEDKLKLCAHDKLNMIQIYNKSKIAHLILRNVAKYNSIPIQTLYKTFGWNIHDAFGSLYDGFLYALQNYKQFVADFDIPIELCQSLLQCIQHKIKLNIMIECTCFNSNGIKAIRSAFNKGKAIANEYGFGLKITAQKSARYILSFSGMNEGERAKNIKLVIDAMTTEIEKYNGNIAVVDYATDLYSTNLCTFRKSISNKNEKFK